MFYFMCLDETLVSVACGDLLVLPPDNPNIPGKFPDTFLNPDLQVVLEHLLRKSVNVDI